jgi:hypothetical protein
MRSGALVRTISTTRLQSKKQASTPSGHIPRRVRCEPLLRPGSPVRSARLDAEKTQHMAESPTSGSASCCAVGAVTVIRSFADPQLPAQRAIRPAADVPDCSNCSAVIRSGSGASPARMSRSCWLFAFCAPPPRGGKVHAAWLPNGAGQISCESEIGVCVSTVRIQTITLAFAS